MDEVIRLNLADLPTMHPQFDLEAYAHHAVVRLIHNPVRLDDATDSVRLVVNHRLENHVATSGVDVMLGVKGVLSRIRLLRIARSSGEEKITEQGAVAIAALIVAHFKRAEIVTVLQKGTGADYRLEYTDSIRKVALEISGLLCDESPSGADVRKRIEEKRAQLRRGEVRCGLVSVTAFAYQPTGTPYNVLCEELPPATVATELRRLS